MTDKELQTHALLLWAGYIETGVMGLSRADIEEQVGSIGRAAVDNLHGRGVVNRAMGLPADQQELAGRLRALAHKNMAETSQSGLRATQNAQKLPNSLSAKRVSAELGHSEILVRLQPNKPGHVEKARLLIASAMQNEFGARNFVILVQGQPLNVDGEGEAGPSQNLFSSPR